MIEDDELRDLFQTESEEHLQMLDDGFLRLETNPHDKSTLEEVFRAAHSLKGTARMLGVSGVETIAHHLEDELGGVRRGRGTLTSSHIDRFSVGLAAMRHLVHEAVSGTPANVDVQQVLTQMSGTVPFEMLAADAVVNNTPVKAAPNNATPVELLPTLPTLPTPPTPPTLPEIPALVETTASPAHETINIHEAIDITALAPLNLGTNGSQLAKRESAPPAAAPVTARVTSLVTLRESETAESALELTDSGLAALGLAGLQATNLQATNLQAADVGPPDAFKIQTMRVPPAKLDALMTLASELTVTSTRVIRGMTAFEEIELLWEEWNKDMAGQRSLWQAAEGSPGDAAKRLAAFQTREQTRLSRLRLLWEQFKQTTYQDVMRLNFVADELEEGIRNVRLLPLSQIFNLFPRLVRDLARELNKEIDFTIEGGDTAADKRILEELKDPLMHMLRNAIDHGIELPHEREEAGKTRVASIRLRAYQTANNVMLELKDDGRGLDITAIKHTALKRRLHTEEELLEMPREQLHLLIFAPGFSTSALVTDVSGRGVGMDVVRINIERLKGSIRVQSEPGKGTTFTVRLPSTLTTTRVLLVTVAGRPYAIPVEWVQTIVHVSRNQIFSIEGRQTIVLDERALPLVRLSSLLELQPGPVNDAEIYVVMEVGEEHFGVQVEGLVDEQEVMLKPLGALLKRVRNVSGVTILGAGEICMVLNAHDLAKAALQNPSHHAPMAQLNDNPPENAPRKVILLAEDSITTRTQEKRILEGAGYDVVTAVDGADAFQKLAARDFDAVVSDVEMPNMNGLTLAARIRENPRYDELPIILVTSLASDDDKRRGVEVGANAYITKGTFEQKVLLETLRRLV